MKFEEFLKTKIFNPLNMKDTLNSDDRSKIVENSATGHILVSNEIRTTPLITNALAGTGGIQTNGIDFLNYDKNFYDNKLIGGQELIKKIITPGIFFLLL
jgi:CubicO group peptidase (beta-lactamase class C family)